MTWRIGRHYGIHVYEGDRPVATFHRAEDAQRAVLAVNAPPDPPGGDPAVHDPQHAYDVGWISDETLHGPWDKAQQRYEDGCKSGDRHDATSEE